MLVGNSDTTYQTPKNINPLAGVNLITSVSGGDINGEGKGDLVAASNSPPVVFLLLENGNCGFIPQTPIQGFTSPSQKLRDVNGDGKLDIVLSDVGTGKLKR